MMVMVPHYVNPAFVGKRACDNDKQLATTTNRGRENAMAWFLYSDGDPANASGVLDGKPSE